MIMNDLPCLSQATAGACEAAAPGDSPMWRFSSAEADIYTDSEQAQRACSQALALLSPGFPGH